MHVASFPGFSNARQVSSEGGMQPIWRRDGRELFYLSPRGELMSVEARAGTGTTLETSAPRALFRTSLKPSMQLGEYAVSGDGQRFLLLDPVGGRAPRGAEGLCHVLARQQELRHGRPGAPPCRGDAGA